MTYTVTADTDPNPEAVKVKKEVPVISRFPLTIFKILSTPLTLIGIYIRIRIIYLPEYKFNADPDPVGCRASPPGQAFNPQETTFIMF